MTPPPGFPRRRPLVFGAVLTAVLIAIVAGAFSGVRLGSQAKQQRGFALPTWNTDGYDDPRLAESLRQMANLGAEWVQINPTWYQGAVNANAIERQARTASDAGVERVVSLAHEQGLKVLLKPHVDISDGEYRGYIRPSDPAGWFAAYRTFIGHYARLATRTGAEQLAVGTELAGVSADRASWLEVIRLVRAEYSGPLVYAANYDEYSQVAFWDAVDLIGVDAYWPLSQQPTVDVSQLERAWRPIRSELAAFSAKAGRRILFTEAGYTSQRGAMTTPYSWTVSQLPAPAEQAAGYQALLTSFSEQAWWAGVFWWAWTVPSTDEDPALGYSPHGKAAERVVRRWWT
jgi:hypothetical protein